MRKILFLLALSVICVAASAQSKSFEFYYIAHDRETPVADLCDRLEEAYEMTRRYDDIAAIFYLPNFNEPKVVKVNLPGDNREDFDNLLSELRLKVSHEIFPEHDYAAILDLINEHDFVDEYGDPAYTSVTFSWYINREFWLFGYNEDIIASLYFVLELDKYEGYVTSQFWYPSDVSIDADKDKPFGNMNLCGKMSFMLLPY